MWRADQSMMEHSCPGILQVAKKKLIATLPNSKINASHAECATSLFLIATALIVAPPASVSSLALPHPPPSSPPGI